MTIRMQKQIESLEERIKKLEEIATAAERDLQHAIQGELFSAERLDLTNLRVLFGLKVPEPTALPAPSEEETPFDS